MVLVGKVRFVLFCRSKDDTRIAEQRVERVIMIRVVAEERGHNAHRRHWSSQAANSTRAVSMS